MNCHVQQKVKVGKTVCDEASVVPWEVHYTATTAIEKILLNPRCSCKVLNNRDGYCG